MNGGLNARVEFLLAKPYATTRDLEAHVATARSEAYRAIVLPSSLVERAYALIEGTDLKVISAIGFPFGAADADVKRYETEVAVDFGAHAIELIPNLGAFAEKRYKEVLREIRDVAAAADERPVTVTIESHLWNESQLAAVVETILESGAQFLATSIALQGRHCSPEAVQHLRELVGDDFGLKVGGLKTLEGTGAIIAASADRIGLAG